MACERIFCRFKIENPPAVVTLFSVKRARGNCIREWAEDALMALSTTDVVAMVMSYWMFA